MNKIEELLLNQQVYLYILIIKQNHI